MKTKILNKIKNISKKNIDIYRSIIITVLTRGAALVLSLFTLPIYMRFFDNETALGLWFTIVSILNWFLNFDLGIGNGLRNKLVKSLVKKDKVDAKRYISSSYFIISVIALVLGIIFTIIFEYINWNNILNVDSNIIPNSILIKTIKIVFIGILLQFVLRIINSILYAMQKSHVPSIISLITSILTLVIIMILGKEKIEVNIIRLAYANVFATNFPLLIATIIVFAKKLKFAIPNLKFVSKKYAFSVLKLGGIFFGIQIMYMLIVNTNEYLISYFFNPKHVVDYQIYNKLFNLINVLFSILMTPIWSSITKALVEKDYKWIKQTYKKIIFLAFIISLCEFLLIPFLQIIINIWLGKNAIDINYLYALLFAISGSVFIWTSVITTLANGLNKVKSQFYLMILAVIIEFSLLISLNTIFDSWILIIILNIISMIPYCIVETIIINKYLRNLK